MEEDIKNVCFICDITSQVFERDTEEGFEFHHQKDHNVWQYLNFIIHIKSIDSTDLNGTESYILELFEKEDNTWFPMQKSQRLNLQKLAREAAKQAKIKADNDEEDSINNKNVDPMTGVPVILEKIQEQVDEVSKKYK